MQAISCSNICVPLAPLNTNGLLSNILTNMRHFSLNIENVQGYEIENKDFVDCNFNGTTYKVYTKVRDSYEISSSKRQLPFKSNFGVTWPSYGTIDGIPFNSVHGYNLGAAYSMDGDVKTYYQTLNATFTKDIRLYADYYPFHEGTLKAGKDIVISDSNPISQVFKAASRQRYFPEGFEKDTQKYRFYHSYYHAA